MVCILHISIYVDFKLNLPTNIDRDFFGHITLLLLYSLVLFGLFFLTSVPYNLITFAACRSRIYEPTPNDLCSNSKWKKNSNLSD